MVLHRLRQFRPSIGGLERCKQELKQNSPRWHLFDHTNSKSINNSETFNYFKYLISLIGLLGMDTNYSNWSSGYFAVLAGKLGTGKKKDT